MINFASYDVQAQKSEKNDEGLVIGNGTVVSPYADGVPCTVQIPMYVDLSRFAPINVQQFVFPIDMRTPDFSENHAYYNCRAELDIVIGARTKVPIVSLAVMQAIYALERISPYTRTVGGAYDVATYNPRLTFLNAHLGPLGVQIASDRKEALLVVANSTYVRLPHNSTFRLRDDGTIVRSRTRQLMGGDHIYLVFRLVPLSDPGPRYRDFVTSHGPFAWTAAPGIAYPDIITTDRLLAGAHRHIGRVETVEAPHVVRALLTLSSYHDAIVVDET